jgi:hypothetical protein
MQWLVSEPKKTKVLQFDNNQQHNVLVYLKYNEVLLHEEIHTKFVGIEIDKCLNWTTRMH